METEFVHVPAIAAYQAAQAADWDELVARSGNGTFLHSRRFLAYHGDRFRDLSLTLTDRRGRLAGVFPAAEDLSEHDLVISHPGSSYGGIVHDQSVRGAAMIGALEEIAGYYRDLGYRRLRYKVVPGIYQSSPAADDVYALFRLGARHYRCDLSAAIDLACRGPVSQRRVRSRKKAERLGVRTETDWAQAGAFWKILESNLARRRGAAPVHSLDEIEWLHEQFPEQISLIVARNGDDVVAGCVFFAAGPVLHMQYSASSDEGRALTATDVVMEAGIGHAVARGFRFFDFGTSTPNQGRTLDQDLYQYKISFGAGGVAYDHYELDLG